MVAEHGPLHRISERVRKQILHVLISLVMEEMVDVARQISQERIEQRTVEEMPGRIVEPASNDKVAAEDECKSLAMDIKNHKSSVSDLAEQLSATEERLTAVVRIIAEPGTSAAKAKKMRLYQQTLQGLKVILRERVLERFEEQCRTPWRKLCR